MPTVIDSLIIEIGLDPKNFTDGQRKLGDQWVRTRDEAIRSGRDIEQSTAKATGGFEKLRNEVLSLFAVFTAGRGLREFIDDVVYGDSQLARMAKTLDMNIEELSTWSNVAVLAGGNGSDAAQGFSYLTQQIQQFSLTGESSIIPFFRALHISLLDNKDRVKDAGAIYLELADKLHGMDPERAKFFANALGIPASLFNILVQGRKVTQEYLDDARKAGAVHEQNAAAAPKLQHAFGEAELSAFTLGRVLLTTLAPALEGVLKWLTDLAELAQKHPKEVEDAFFGVAGAVTALSAALTVLALNASVGTILRALGLLLSGFGWIVALLPRLLLGLAVLSADALPALSGAFFELGAAIEATPVGWILTGIALVAAAAYELYEHWNDIPKWWEGIWKRIGDGPASAAAKIRGAKGSGAPARILPGAAGSAGDVDKLVAMGWTRAQASGIAANIQRESSGNPLLYGDKGSAYGLAQWHADRQAAFKAWAGHDIRNSTRDEQLAFINYELRYGSRAAAGRRLAGAGSAADAGAIVSHYYEAPRDATGEAYKRGVLAQAIFGSGAGATGLSNPRSASSIFHGGARTVSTATTSHETNVGTLVVNSRSDNAPGIAQDIRHALEQDTLAQQANYGAN